MTSSTAINFKIYFGTMLLSNYSPITRHNFRSMNVPASYFLYRPSLMTKYQIYERCDVSIYPDFYMNEFEIFRVSIVGQGSLIEFVCAISVQVLYIVCMSSLEYTLTGIHLWCMFCSFIPYMLTCSVQNIYLRY